MSKALLKSFLVHSFLVLLILGVSGSLVRISRPMIVDLTGDAAGSPKKAQQSLSKMLHAAKENGQERTAVEKEGLAPEGFREIQQPDMERTSSVPATDEKPITAPVEAARTETTGTKGVKSFHVLTDTGRNSAGGRETAQGGQLYNGSNGNLAYLKAHFSYITELIQRCATYPIFARKMGWEGKVTISFIISSDGRAREVKVLRSSGRDLFDKSAMRAVWEASPFPKPPAEAQLIIPVCYKLN
jgi:protein TonB